MEHVLAHVLVGIVGVVALTVICLRIWGYLFHARNPHAREARRHRIRIRQLSRGGRDLAFAEYETLRALAGAHAREAVVRDFQLDAALDLILTIDRPPRGRDAALMESLRSDCEAVLTDPRAPRNSKECADIILTQLRYMRDG
jgi:hypothetical protein